MYKGRICASSGKLSNSPVASTGCALATRQLANPSAFRRLMRAPAAVNGPSEPCADMLLAYGSSVLLDVAPQSMKNIRIREP